MKKKQLNNRLLLNKKLISNLEMSSAGAIKGGQKPSYTSCQEGCNTYSACNQHTEETCNYSDLRLCTAVCSG